MKRTCCVCLNDVVMTNTVRTCRVCIETHVCAGCFDMMRETNIHQRCPVCRSEHWSHGSDEVLIITDADPFAHTNNTGSISVSINIMLNAAQGETGVREDVCLWRKRLKVTIKVIITTIVLWSLGFIVLSLAIERFYQHALVYVIFGSILAGVLASALAMQWYLLLSF